MSAPGQSAHAAASEGRAAGAGGVLKTTQSLCPVCLRRVDAVYREAADGAVELARVCPEHGEHRAVVWPSPAECPDVAPFLSWRVDKTPSYPEHPVTEIREGCPYDCGLCPAHAQHTCTGLLEVTMRCDLSCPVCYAASGEGHPESSPNAEPDIDTVQAMLDNLLFRSGRCNVQFSGGEPTLRDDLPEMVRRAKKLGFPLVQVNSNGLRLARDPDFVGRLAEAGLDSVYLQWDSLKPDVLRQLRGDRVPDLGGLKERAVANCAAAGLGVVFVATLVRGVNDTEVGALVRDAVSRGSGVRGIHFQPASFFGRSPWGVQESPRLTLGHVMQALADQVPEWFSTSHFHAPCCEHSLCSFSAVYARVNDGLVLEEQVSSLRDHPGFPAEEGSRMAKAFVARQWSRPGKGGEEASPTTSSCCCSTGNAADAFTKFLERRAADRRFTVSCMAFQDALSLDLDRLRGCCIHVARPDGRIVPFCAQNMTSFEGVALYPNRLAR